jgi:type IV secretory pathway ATPase VirB11/archaellum biosynthesis ATPase
MGRTVTDFITTAEIQVVTDAIVARRMLIIGGATSSGKSTLLNAILDLVPAELRLWSSKMLFELKPAPTRNVVRRLATSRADLKAHVFQSLRTRPDWILIGESSVTCRQLRKSRRDSLVLAAAIFDVWITQQRANTQRDKQ